MTHVIVPIAFLKAIGEKPPFYRIYWVKWLADYTHDLFKTDFIATFHSDMSKVGKDLNIETIKEVYEFGIPFFKDGFIFPNKPAKQKNKYSDEVLEIAEKVIIYLNERSASTYTKSKANLEVINARIAEGYSLPDFKRVIDKKTAQWLGTEQQKYLRPITLFALKKFENYLNEPEIETKHGKPKSVSTIDKLSNAASKAKQFFS